MTHRFEILHHADVPDALQSLLDTCDALPGLSFTVGPFDDAELRERIVFVDGADEVEAAHVLVAKFGDNGVRWREL